MQGYVALHRQLMDSWVAEDPLALSLWVRMLLEATHKPRKKPYKGKMYNLEPGQFLFGLGRWSEKTGIGREVIRNRVDMFEKDGMITRSKQAQTSVITIVNWNMYQRDNRVTTDLQHTDNTAATDSQQQYNNVNNGDNGNNVDKKDKPQSASQAKPDERDEIIQGIFDYWHSTMNKDPRVKLTGTRKSKVSGRLRDGFTPREICEAIKGCSMTPWNMGDNPRNKSYNDLDFICKDDKNLNGFIETFRASNKPWSAATQQTIDTLNNMELD